MDNVEGFSQNSKSLWGSETQNSLSQYNIWSCVELNLNNDLFKTSFNDEVSLNSSVLNILDNKGTEVSNRYVDYVESSRWLKRSNGLHQPIRIIKRPISSLDLNSNNSNIIRFRFNDGLNLSQEKPISNSNYFSFKQKRYTRKKVIKPVSSLPNTDLLYNKKPNKDKISLYKAKPFLFNNSVIVDNFYDSTTQYKLIKKNKKRSEIIPVTLARRILRTKRTLVLPAHMNITVVTNSYDIVHSWFIPGLGIKLDCVPGRSTHHTFYIDSVGFYYGQCAEVCGRYHHHMPIRMCALPFEHFLV
jgi:hypothetical protein